MITAKTIKNAQKIIDSYDCFPYLETTKDSLIEELANYAVDEMFLQDAHFVEFDWDGFLKPLNLKRWTT